MSNTTTSADNHDNHRSLLSPQEVTTYTLQRKPTYIVPSQLLLARVGAEFMSVNAPAILAVLELTDLKKDLKNQALIVIGVAGVVGYLSFDCARVLMRGLLFKALLFTGFLCEFSLLLVLMGEMMWGQETIQAPYMLIFAFAMSLIVTETNSYFSTKESFLVMKLPGAATGCLKLCQILRLPTLGKWMHSLFLLCCMIIKFLNGKVISLFRAGEVWEITENRGGGFSDIEAPFDAPPPLAIFNERDNHLILDTDDFFYSSLEKFLYKNMNLMLLESTGIMALMESKKLFIDVHRYILCCTVLGTFSYYLAIGASRGPWLVFLAGLGNAMKTAIWLAFLGSLEKKPAYYVSMLLVSIVVSFFPLTYRYYFFQTREEKMKEAMRRQ